MISPDSLPTPDGRVVVLDGSRLAGLRDWRALADVAVLVRTAGAATGLLLDVRHAPFTPTGAEADVLVAALAGYPAVAIVSGGDASFGCARMVSMLVEIRGSSAAAFLAQGEAEEWLSVQVGPSPLDAAAVRKPARL